MNFADLKALFVTTTMQAGVCAHGNLPDALEAGEWLNYREDQPL